MATDNSVKILVLYDSLTGNVEEMAKHVAAGAGEIQGVEVRLRKVEGAGELKATAPGDEQCRLACRCLGRRLAEWTATYVHGIATAHPSLKLAQRRPPHG